MKRRSAVPVLFGVAAVYDGMMGLAFLFAARAMFQWFCVTPPNHLGYVQFPGALLIVFAVMFVAIARDPSGQRNLIPYGILMKAAYCGVVFFHWFAGGIPGMWKPFAVIDLGFMALFIWVLIGLKGTPPAEGRARLDAPGRAL